MVRKLAHSSRLALPSTTAPARRSRRTTPASRLTTEPSSASDPAVVLSRSRVAMLSLRSTGTPWSPPQQLPDDDDDGDAARRLRERVGVDLDDGVEERVEAGDAVEVEEHELPGGEAAVVEAELDVVDGGLLDLEHSATVGGGVDEHDGGEKQQLQTAARHPVVSVNVGVVGASAR
ncbi:hypothetical protein OsJ_13964 [Oryza sativa Japonica Group]|uniref:Uncharacterized protein n=1 Tax=Oryza sativa subsp. japonica TaxID=39947 RepID=B9FE02_ORYSJ|nr:hypothetical protein OsJ_13964 [Oryza sativa Japonica Group]